MYAETKQILKANEHNHIAAIISVLSSVVVLGGNLLAHMTFYLEKAANGLGIVFSPNNKPV